MFHILSVTRLLTYYAHAILWGQRSSACRSLVRGYSMCTHVCAQTLQHEKQGKTLDCSELSIKPAMLVSSVQAVVACYVTALRVCTLVL